MPYLKYNENSKPIAYATSPPSSEADLWEEVSDDDPDIAALLNAVAIAVKWGEFRPIILEDPDFRTTMAGLIAVDTLGGVSLMTATGSDNPNQEFIIKTWNALRAGYPGVIPVEAIARWNDALSAANVPMRWLENGQLEAT